VIDHDQQGRRSGSEHRNQSPEEVSLSFAQAITDGDLESAAGAFAANACLLTADGEVLRGRAPIRQLLDQLLANRPAMQVQIDQMHTVGEIAIGSERWRMTFELADGSTAEQSGTSTVVLRRSERGWELCFNAPWGLVSPAAE
jgi:uncharacterized protein (TIGR02246 family)